MSSLPFRVVPHADAAHCTENELVVSLSDGRTLSVSLAWFPRLARATAEQLARIELLGDGEGIHWPEVDEDVSVAGLLEGRASIECRAAMN